MPRKSRQGLNGQQVHVILTKEDDIVAYIRLTALVKLHGLTVSHFVVNAIHQAVRDLEKRRLPFGESLHLSGAQLTPRPELTLKRNK